MFLRPDRPVSVAAQQQQQQLARRGDRAGLDEKEDTVQSSSSSLSLSLSLRCRKASSILFIGGSFCNCDGATTRWLTDVWGPARQSFT